jgi:CYTH domain-containing protein/predicted ATPase
MKVKKIKRVKTIRTIVFSGGPCGGKTSAVCYVQEKLSNLGYTVVVIGEGATEFILSGLTPENLGTFNFQYELLMHILEKENRMKDAAKLIKSDNIIILCDRGCMDLAAYTPHAQFEMMLESINYTVVDLRDRPYNAVLILRSVAVDKPEVYSCGNNPARKEDIETAKELDQRIIAAWTGHPYLRIFDNSTDLEGKLKRVFQEICRLLGILTPLEIERRYLLSQCDIAKIKKIIVKTEYVHVEHVHIIQCYLHNNEGKEERVRERMQRSGRTYYHTVKEFAGAGARIKNERQINQGEFIEYLHYADTTCGIIEKLRTCFVWKNQYFEVDFFSRPQGLILLEVELTEENTNVVLPHFIAPYAIEVTNDPDYSNYAIAKRIAK